MDCHEMSFIYPKVFCFRMLLVNKKKVQNTTMEQISKNYLTVFPYLLQQFLIEIGQEC